MSEPLDQDDPEKSDTWKNVRRRSFAFESLVSLANHWSALGRSWR
jgi:hypothetical protein